MAINRKIVVSFNQAMNPTTITTATFTVTGPGVTPVLGTVTYDATNNIAIFAPKGLLPVSTTFTGTITTGAKSAAGVPLASNFVWNFVTSADSDTTKPTVISIAPDHAERVQVRRPDDLAGPGGRSGRGHQRQPIWHGRPRLRRASSPGLQHWSTSVRAANPRLFFLYAPAFRAK